MHRAGQRALIVFLVPLLGGWHAGAFFDKAPGAGGGGGLFYTGSPRERGWDCTACHVAPQAIRVDLTVDPPELLQGRYTPGAVYAFRLVLHEEQGLRSPTANHNGLAVTVVQPDLLPAGDLGGFAADEFYARGDNILATAGLTPGVTEWAFTWTAPAEPVPLVGFYLGVVDGDGARVRPGVVLNDPEGDDVWMSAFSAVPR